MKARYLLIVGALLLHLLLPCSSIDAAAYSSRYDVEEFKGKALDLPLAIVSPSLRNYLTAFQKKALVDGLFFYYKESKDYPHLDTEERLLEEMTSVYSSLKKRLQSSDKGHFHYNNVIQFGILADLVIRYMGYEPGGSVYVHWGGFQELGDNPSEYIRSFGYNNRDVNAAVNAIANLWLNAWGKAEGFLRAGYPFIFASGEGKKEAIRPSPSTSGGQYTPSVAEQTQGGCFKPYIDTLYPGGGLDGDQVKVRGKRFGQEKGEVIFNPGIKAEVVSWTNRRINVTVPKGATSGPVTVSVPCGAVSNQKYFAIAK